MGWVRAFWAIHLIDEFEWQAPIECHLAEGVTEQRAFSHMQAVVDLVALAAWGGRAGFSGLAIAGGIIVTADLGKPLGGPCGWPAEIRRWFGGAGPGAHA